MSKWTYIQLDKCPIGLHIVGIGQLDIQYVQNVQLDIFSHIQINFFRKNPFKMPPPKHSLTQYISVLSEKANKFNYFALCRFCNNKITNTKRLVHSHLKSCNKFEEQYS